MRAACPAATQSSWSARARTARPPSATGWTEARPMSIAAPTHDSRDGVAVSFPYHRSWTFYSFAAASPGSRISYKNCATGRRCLQMKVVGSISHATETKFVGVIAAALLA
eukprot:scaffold393327_cov40-Prasinocladus_malaysianus.AAC.1